MMTNYKNHFSNQRTFRDITSQSTDVVEITTGSLQEEVITKVYERKGTNIIHTKSEKTNHASISNAQRQIHEWEIAYVIEQVLKVDNENVTMFASSNGVIHLYAKEDSFLLN